MFAFPVLWDTVYVEGEPERKPVGVFMSIIKEENQAGQSYFKDFKLPQVALEFENKIKRIRAIISLLAKVENIEIYQKGIRRHQEEERVKHSRLVAIAGSTHFLKSWVNIILRSKVPKEYEEHIDEVLNIPEIVNLISKIYIIKDKDKEEKIKTLNESQLLRTMQHFEISSVVAEFQNIIIYNRKVSFSIDSHTLIKTKKDLAGIFNEKFYRLLFSVIAENAIENMPSDKSFSLIHLTPHRNIQNNQVDGLTFKNISSKKPISTLQTKEKRPSKVGGLYYFDFFLHLLGMGEITFNEKMEGDEVYFMTNLILDELSIVDNQNDKEISNNLVNSLSV